MLTLTRPDDWHLHVRDGTGMRDVVGHTARVFGRAVLMPNLKPPVTTVADALAYRERVLAALPDDSGFQPLMTLYLTDRTTPEEVALAAATEGICGVKLYPAGATTNSAAGVSQLDAMDPVLAAMAEHGLPLLVHGEVTHDDVDIFDRESMFLDLVLGPMMARHGKLRVVVEHATTEDAVAFVRRFDDGRVGCTITPQHLLLNRNALFAGGLRPHHYCLPVLKRERHRLALLEAATSGDPRFFLGTDSAPHVRGTKESACGCAGCFSAPHALELYAIAFDMAGALDRLEGFASHHGPDWYGLPRNTDTVTLVQEPREVPGAYAFGEGEVVPLFAGEDIGWAIA
jgi:dihydroorotase